MQLVDKHIAKEPTASVLKMQSMLKDHDVHCSYERVDRLMRKANIRVIYPRKRLSILKKNMFSLTC